MTSAFLRVCTEELATDIMSFMEDEAVNRFLFRLCDIDGDGFITPSDLALFVYVPHLTSSYRIYLLN
jgi:hypothetical protein